MLIPNGTRFWHMPAGRGCGAQIHRAISHWPHQAVRIPVEFESPGDEVIIRRDGDRVVFDPVRKRGLIALLKTTKPLNEVFPEIDDPDPAESVL